MGRDRICPSSQIFMSKAAAPEPIPQPELPPVCVTLCLTSVKSGKSQRIAGARAQYEFKWHEGHRALCREYRSIEVFYREEADMRKNHGNPFAITTLLGTTHPVAQAMESVKTLIASSQRVDSTTRAAALRDIIALAETEIARINAPLVELPPPEKQPSVKREPAVKLNTAGWKDAKGVPVTNSVPDENPGALTKPVSTGGPHTQAELMQGGIESVRVEAKRLGIPTHTSNGAVSRVDLVKAIIAAEEKQAA